MIDFIDGVPYLIFSLVLLGFAWRRYGLIPYPTGIAIWVLASQLIFTLVAADLASYPFLRVFSRGGLVSAFDQTMIIYSVISLFSVLSFIGAKVNVQTDVLKMLRDIGASGSQTKQKVRLVIYIATAVIFSYVFIYIVVTDWDYATLNYTYQSREFNSSVVEVIGESAPSLIIRMLNLIAMIVPLILIATMIFEMRALSVLYMILCFLMWIYILSTNSRAAVFIPGVICVGFLFFRLNGARFIGPIAGLVSVYSLLSSLVGRAGLVQGFSGLSDTFESILNAPFVDSFVTLWTNFCEGVFVVGEGAMMEPMFPANYQWLSISPTVSTIDGFSAILDVAQVRIHPFVPMSSYTELINFSPIVSILGALVVLATVRLSLEVAKRSVVVFFIINVILFFSMMYAGSYPVRGVMRGIWLAFLIGAGYLVFARRKSGAADARQAMPARFR